jgi:hypothetical protein
MRKQTSKRLQLNPETMKVLQVNDLQDIVGGKPVTTRDLPCIPPPP